jgi:prevent-host-death family protein
MANSWQLQEAKARLSEVIKRAAADGPQVVTQRGVETAVVLSIDEYRRLKDSKPSFAEYLLSGPKLADEYVDLINDRPRDVGRDIEL